MTTATERLLDTLRDHGSRVVKSSTGHMAQCPAHEDRTPSLGVTAGDGAALVKCWAGCDTADVLTSLGLSYPDLFDEPKGRAYTYVNPDGSRNRTVTRTPGKDFRQSGNKGQPVVLFRLPEVLAAVTAGDVVTLTEGEKDAVVFAEHFGHVATSAPMGADNFDKVDVSPLAGADVRAIPDQDTAGEKWSAQVERLVRPIAGSLTFYRPKGKDVAEHVTRYGLDDFELIESRPDTSWRPVNLDDVLDGTYVPEVASLMPRTDGIGLLYPGRTHDFHGESESGKSLIVQAEAARLLNTGGTVLYLDFESDRVSVVRRLLDLGAEREAIRARFAYVHPEEPPTASTAARTAWDDLLGHRWNLAVLDGATEALSLLAARDSGGDPNERIAAFLKRYPTRLANSTGAAVVMVDHVTKSSEGRGRHAIGGQHKMNGLTGASYVVDVETQPQRGKVGILSIRIGKDRPAGIRPHCGPFRSDRTQPAARVLIDSTGPTLRVTFEAVTAQTEDGQPWRPTEAMAKCLRILTDASEALPFNRIAEGVGMRRATIAEALRVLVDEHQVTCTTGARGAHLYSVSSSGNQSTHNDDRNSPQSGSDQFPLRVGELGTGQTGLSDQFPELLGTGGNQSESGSVEPPTPTELNPHAGEKCSTHGTDVDPVLGFCWACREAG